MFLFEKLTKRKNYVLLIGSDIFKYMKPLAIAHRGKHDTIYFENTVNAFKLAKDLDFFGIETDIHLSKDNKWIIHHNPEILSSNKLYKIKDYSYDELVKLHLDNNQNDKDAYICLLEDYLKVIKGSNKHPFIEIKNKQSYKELRNLVNLIKRYFDFSEFTIISFHPAPLFKLRRLYKRKIHLQVLIEKHTELLLFARVHHMDIDIEQNRLNQKIVNKFHKKNLKVNVWTVNNKKSLDKLTQLGVNYITSDVFDQNS